MTIKQKRFRDAVAFCVMTFQDPQNRRSVMHKQKTFWAALWLLEYTCHRMTLTCKLSQHLDSKTYFNTVEKHLGSPEDFSVGTPCGDALRDVYETWNDLVEERKG